MKIKRYTLFLNNPEFTRNVWATFSFLGLGLVLLLMINLLAFAHYHSTDYQVFLNIYLAFALFILGFWGTHNVINAFLLDFKQGTWDYQRLSTISPMQMIVGKLLGPSIMQWLLAIVLFFAMLFHLQYFAMPNGYWMKLFTYWICFSLIVLILQCNIIINFLLMWRKNSNTAIRKTKGSSIAFILLVLGYILTPWGEDQFWSVTPQKTIMLFGMALTTMQYILIIVVSLTLWSILALYNLFRSEFGQKISPLWWAGFLLFVYIFYYGTQFLTRLPYFNYQKNSLLAWLTVSSIFTAVTIYLMLYFANKEASIWVRLGRYWQYSAKTKLFYSIPNWLVSYVFTIIFAILVCVTVAYQENSLSDATRAFVILLSCILFITRDILLVLYFNLARRSGYLIMIFLLLYLSYPMNIKFIPAGLFFPSFDGTSAELTLAIISPLLQSAIVLVLFKVNWQKFMPSFKE